MNRSIDENMKYDSVCILGLTFTIIDVDSVIQEMDDRISKGLKYNIVTPNLNFITSAYQDAHFREAVYRCDASLPDGMPIVWISKILGLPIKQRLAGSDLFERLRKTRRSDALKVAFFGGQSGAGEAACTSINESSNGLHAVGSIDPGFVSIDEMSTAKVIHEINDLNADFLVVALGAKKGIEWIDINHSRLNYPVISHLGAVINFEAGTVKRAPVLLQRFGLEWLWRVYEEPALYRRYLSDGALFIRLLLTRVLPYALWLLKNPAREAPKPEITIRCTEDITEVTITGVVNGTNLDSIKPALIDIVKLGKNVHININSVSYFDSVFLGTILVLNKAALDCGCTIKLATASLMHKKLLRWHLMEDFIRPLEVGGS